jgi:hypothetical protein
MAKFFKKKREVAVPSKGIYLTTLPDVPAKDLCLLTFRKPVSVYSRDVVEWHAGIRRDGKVGSAAAPAALQAKWVKVDHAFVAANKARFQHELLWDMEAQGSPSIAYLVVLCDEICRFVGGFTHDTRNGFFERLRGPVVESAPSALVKALGVAFAALGITLPPGQGMPPAPASDFRVEDVQAYLDALLAAGKKRLDGLIHGGFDADPQLATMFVSVTSDPTDVFLKWSLKADRGTTDANPYGDYLRGVADRSAATKDELAGAPTEDKQFRSALKNPAVGYVFTTEYGFRGESRPPCEIMSLGGFFPNAVRDDKRDAADHTVNKAWCRFDKAHPGPCRERKRSTLDRMRGKKAAPKAKGSVFGGAALPHFPSGPDNKNRGVAASTGDGVELLDSYDHQAGWGSDYSGYVSVSRSMRSAFMFALLNTTGTRAPGYLYACRALDAVDVEATWVKPRYNEREVSVPGGIPWSEVVAFRRFAYASGQDVPEWDSPVFFLKDAGLLPAPKRAELLKMFSYPIKNGIKAKAPPQSAQEAADALF